MAEHLLGWGNRFGHWEILTCLCRFYAPTNREKLSDLQPVNMHIGFVDFQGLPVQNWFPNSVQTGPNRSL